MKFASGILSLKIQDKKERNFNFKQITRLYYLTKKKFFFYFISVHL